MADHRCSRTGYDSDFLSLSFSFFSSVGIIHFATISVVHVVMDIFISQDTSRLFIDFCFVFYWGHVLGGFLYLRACAPTALELI